MKPYRTGNLYTVYQGDYRSFKSVLPDGLVITDPPYNIGFKGYDVYNDSLPDDVYMNLLSGLKAFSRLVIIHYPEETARFIIPVLGAAQHYGAWCYNLNTPRRFRLISYYGCEPDYSLLKQPYKNPGDKRIKGLVENGSNGADLYEWWDDIQIVKNTSQEKTSHPCPVPEKLIKRIITLTALPGDVILDPFAGSLTTLKAAQDLGYQSVGCELSAAYIQEGVERLSQMPMLFQVANSIALDAGPEAAR